MRNQPLAVAGPFNAQARVAGTDPLHVSEALVTGLVEGIEVVELPDRKQRKLNELRCHIDHLLDEGWVIAKRNPLTLQRNTRVCYVLHGMLISDSLN
ncbi:hypothetical protein [Halopseudomonas salina]|nr:hypothetical protein [Halopseudomonas salina]